MLIIKTHILQESKLVSDLFKLQFFIFNLGNYFEDMTGLEIINNRSDIQSRDLLATDTLSVSQSQFVDPKLKIGDMPTVLQFYDSQVHASFYIES